MADLSWNDCKLVSCLQYTPPTTPGLCSDYLDGFASTFDRYMFVISLFARNGFYVVLDNQLNDDPTLINQGQDVWLGYWRQIATAVAADPYAVNKVIIDGLNVSYYLLLSKRMIRSLARR